jgi:hypothetical protein
MEHMSKLDARTRHSLSRTSRGAEGGPRAVSILVQGARPFGDEELNQLRAVGAEIQTVAGDVLTADVPIEKVADVAGHDFVMRVEASAPLHTEGEARGTPHVPRIADVE